MDELVLIDDVNNTYKFTSVGCVEHNNVFFEVYEHPHEYLVVWCHEDELPSTFEDFMEKSAGIIDYRDGLRKFTSDDPELGALILSELNV